MNEPPLVSLPMRRPHWVGVLSPLSALCGERQMLWGGCGIALCLAVMSAVSFLRAILDGHLDPDNSNLPLTGYLLVVLPIAGAQLLSGWLFMKAWAGASQLSWKRIWAVALLIHVCAAAALPLSSNDIYSNLANGKLWAEGLNPYLHTPAELGPGSPFQPLVPEMWRGVTAPYGPMVLYFSRLATQTGGLWSSILAFKLQATAVSLVSVLLALGYCRQCLPAEAARRSFLFVAWNPLVAWELTGQAHNDVLLVAGTTAFIWAASRNREWLAGLLISGAFCAKFAVAPLIGLYGIYVLRRSPARGLGLLACLAGVCGLLFAPLWAGMRTFDGVWFEASSPPWHVCQSLVSVLMTVARLVNPDWTLGAYWLWTLPCKIGMALLALGLAWRTRTLEQVLAGGMLFLFLYQCLAMGWFFPWYVTWLFPLAMARGDKNWQFLVAVYSILAPIVYIPEDGMLLGALALHAVPLVLLWRQRRKAGREESPAGVDSRLPLPDSLPLAA